MGLCFHTCLSFWVSASVHAGIHPPGADTPPLRSRHPLEVDTPPRKQTPRQEADTPGKQTHPLGSRHTPRKQTLPEADTPSGSRHSPPPAQCMLGDTGNKRVVRILLECILVRDKCESSIVHGKLRHLRTTWKYIKFLFNCAGNWHEMLVYTYLFYFPLISTISNLGQLLFNKKVSIS